MLSPDIPRIIEYEKHACKTVYFWPWSLGELRALIQDSNLPIDEDTLSDRYRKFGGVLRHVLGQMERAEEEILGRLSQIWIETLTSTVRDDERFYVSGYVHERACHRRSSISNPSASRTIDHAECVGPT